ncbi:sugar ABC transporter permease [Lentisphaera profundi]|uniref:Sugar ABC transporter permease n=1 Tax=Lentisphaera profundi TaxID=1658616 RepID=A0ABY7VWN7_9BACT|nr:sugar ABC transporter permease [Lentisphaera profundi]WDE98507.1 sugar ABC transporter permease [Lentisphaera profundi]
MSFTSDPNTIANQNSTESFIGLSHYYDLIKDPTYHKALKNTTVYTLGSICIIIPFSFFLAHLLLACQKTLRPIFSFILIVPGITPPIVLSILFLLFFHGENGILNQFIAAPLLSLLKSVNSPWAESLPDFINWQKDPRFIMFALIFQSVWRWTGFITLFFLCSLQAIPKNLEEAIELEGASFFKRLIHLRIPACSHVILFAIIYLMVDSIAMFAGAYRLLGGSGGTDDAGLLLISYVYQTGFTFQQFNRAAAISMSIVPGLASLIWLLFWRQKKDVVQ